VEIEWRLQVEALFARQCARQLILVGRNTLADDDAAADAKRLQTVEDTSGALAGVFGTDYLKELREDWPE
jgi:hypothetical protein